MRFSHQDHHCILNFGSYLDWSKECVHVCSVHIMHCARTVPSHVCVVLIFLYSHSSTYSFILYIYVNWCDGHFYFHAPAFYFGHDSFRLIYHMRRQNLSLFRTIFFSSLILLLLLSDRCNAPTSSGWKKKVIAVCMCIIWGFKSRKKKYFKMVEKIGNWSRAHTHALNIAEKIGYFFFS